MGNFNGRAWDDDLDTDTVPDENITSITVTLGEQSFAPVQYHSFKVGPFAVTLTLKDGETVEQAYIRGRDHLAKIAKIDYAFQRDRFYDALRNGGK